MQRRSVRGQQLQGRQLQGRQLQGRRLSENTLTLIVHVSILATLAFSQPLFALLAENIEFFTAHKTTRPQVLAFILIVATSPILLSVIMLNLFKLFGRNNYERVYCLVITLLVALIVLPFVRYLVVVPGFLEVSISISMGILFTWGYCLSSSLRESLTYLAPMIVIFPLIFFFSSEVRTLSYFNDKKFDDKMISGKGNRAALTPVVLIIFDEFTINSILNAEYKIDEINYPNLAWFSKKSHWFKNATTVADGTTHAIPSILSGGYGGDKLPTYQNYSNNLFTLLRDNYTFNVHESATQLCPENLCDHLVVSESNFEKMALLLVDSMVLYSHIVSPVDYRSFLPDISQGWTHFLDGYQIQDRVDLWRQFLSSIPPVEKPSLNVMHILLPHTPLQYLPDGTDYKPQVIRGLSGEVWSDDEWAVQQAWQRHLLQLAFVDKLLGELFETLKSKSLFDESLVIITADHGVSFRPEDMRRPLSDSNFMDIMPIPLFVKLPHQQEGFSSNLNVESVDILPTIMDVLGMPNTLLLDGYSVFDTEMLSNRKEKSILSFRNGEKVHKYPAIIDQKKVSIEKRLTLFPLNNLFVIGREGSLLGKNVKQFLSGKSEIFYLETEKDVTNRLFKQKQGPNFVRGGLYETVPVMGPIRIALAVNDTLVAVSRTFKKRLENSHDFEFLVPKSAYANLENEVKIYVIGGGQQNGYTLDLVQREQAISYAIKSTSSKLDTLTSDSGTIHPIKKIALSGFLDEITEDEGWLYFRGWAISLNDQMPAYRIALFIDDEFISAVRPSTLRPDISLAYGGRNHLKYGFHIVIKSSHYKMICSGDFEIYALSKNGDASKLNIPLDRVLPGQLSGC